MSSRTLKKIQLKQKLEQCQGQPEQVEEDDESSSDENVAGPANKFGLLSASLPSDEDDREADIEKLTSEELEEVVLPSTGARKKKWKKKGKHVKPIKKEATEDEDDEIEKSLREVNALLGEATMQQPQTPSKKTGRHLLSVEYKHLNPVNEMKRRFGSKVVEDNQRENRRARQGRQLPSANLIIQKANGLGTQHMPAISMVQAESKDGYTTFKFQHQPAYQKIQADFQKVSESANPQVLLALTKAHPSHIDTLLQVSEMFRQSEDQALAAQLIERTIFVHEASFHPFFNVTTAKCRLQYKQKENRAFFVALFRHAIYVSQRGCYRTALELCKLLLSLSPEDDPLAVSLMMDYFALQCREYAWFYNLYTHYTPTKNLSMLPNFAFSVPLALFHLSNESAKQKSKQTAHESVNMSGSECGVMADEMLQEALLMFPGVLCPLLDKCRVKPDPQVAQHPYFGTTAQSLQTKALGHLVKLFIYRNYHVWKETSVLQWLENNVHKAIERLDACEDLAETYVAKRDKCFVGMPLAIYRHLFMAEVSELTFELPSSATESGVLSCDPMPPADSFCDYDALKVNDLNTIDQNYILETFFRSLMPTYDPTAASEEQGVDPRIQERLQTLLQYFRDMLAPNTLDGGGHDADEDTAN